MQPVPREGYLRSHTRGSPRGKAAGQALLPVGEGEIEMARLTFPRESYIPTGATKVTDKGSDAVAYLYMSGGRPGAVGFHGKASRPDWLYVFRDSAERERAVRGHFEVRRRKAARRAERSAETRQPHGLQVGHVFVASWGYDQTNVDFYQVTAIVGTCMVEVRAIAQADASTGREPWATGKAVPGIDAFTGEPMRRRVNGKRRSININKFRTAHLWDGRPQSWTAYA